MPIIRIPVTLSSEDNQLMIKLQSILQSEQNKRLSVAAIVRMALQELAKSRNIS